METQEKILKSALHLFFNHVIKRVTMDDIAKDLGISKKTIYLFFKEKDDLINQLCEFEMLNQERYFADANKQAKDPIHEIFLISKKIEQMMHNINPVFFIDLKKFHPIAFERFQNFKQHCAYKNLLNNIKKGKEIGLYRADIDEEFTANYRMSQMDMLMFGNYFSFERISFNQTHQLLLDLFVYSICTVKGHKLINNYKKINDEE
jgi:AcrR family transcriptional regulator